MDRDSLRRLEFHKIQEMLSNQAQFSGGVEKAQDLQPVNDMSIARRRLAETGEGITLLRFRDTGFLAGLEDIGLHLQKVRAGAALNPAELVEVSLVLRASRLAREITHEERYPYLRAAMRELCPYPELESSIKKAIDEGGEVRDDASPELKTIRNRISVTRARLKEYLREFIRSPHNQKYLQDAIVTERGGRYVVPVKAEYRTDIKGIIHDESASGATVFIEPVAVVEANNNIRRLEIIERREVERILRELSSRIAPRADELEQNMDLLKELDFILARARLALKMDAIEPRLNDRGIMDIRRARHPLLGSGAVPIDIQLGKGFDILVITGPNTGGKTVALKTVGLLSLMGMAGLFIPAAEGSEIPLVDAVYADIGDEQSIEQSLSTFSSHMSNIIRILEKSRKTSLVLLDELGAGTDPLEGASLARAILEELLARGVRAVVTTHQSELKAFAFQHERVENASVEFDPRTLMPTYRLSIGIPGHSNAFEIAQRLGLEQSIVERARRFVPQQEQELGRIITELKESQFRLETERKELQEMRRQLVEQKRLLREEEQRLNEEKRSIIDHTRKEAEHYLRRVKSEAETVLTEVKESLKAKEALPKWHELERARHKVRKLSVIIPREEEPVTGPVDLTPGSYVEIRTIGQKGYILEGPNSQGEVLVQVGILKLTVKQEDLAPSQSPEQQAISKKNNTFLEKARLISPEIDLRGLTADDAIVEVEKYLENAFLAGIDRVRIIHGKGTGVLRRAVQELLAQHPRVKSFRDGDREEGGTGVTVAYL